MKTPAIIASLTVVGSIAFAAGNGSATSAAAQIPGQRSEARTRESLQGQTMTASDCPAGEPVIWFSPTPRLVPCGDDSPQLPLLTAQIGPVDVNSDGKSEFWRFDSVSFTGSAVVVEGTPTGTELKIWVDRPDPLTGAPTTIRDSVVVVPASFGNWVVANFPGTTSAQAFLNAPESNWTFIGRASGFRDMDGDGDLDYLVVLSLSSGRRQVWFENTGFEKPAPPVAADLNRDGRVDGADLGMLLIAWGPTN